MQLAVECGEFTNQPVTKWQLIVNEPCQTFLIYGMTQLEQLARRYLAICDLRELFVHTYMFKYLCEVFCVVKFEAILLAFDGLRSSIRLYHDYHLLVKCEKGLQNQ